MSDHYQTPGAHITPDTPDEFYQPKFLSFSGRIGRLRWLAYNAAVGLFFYLILGIALVVVGDTEALMKDPQAFKAFTSGAMGVVFWGLYVVFMVYYLALIRRRLNDMDRSGWLMLLMLVPFINLILALFLLFAPGTHGRNRFGPAPWCRCCSSCSASWRPSSFPCSLASKHVPSLSPALLPGSRQVPPAPLKY